MASYFGIQDWFYKDVGQLSGGQKQLLNLASIMAMQPDVLILDEPTSQLDPIAAADFLNTVRKINLELGTTILITEHRLEDIYHAADRVVVMDQGQILTDGTPRQVCDFCKDGSTRCLRLCRRRCRCIMGSVASAVENCPLTVREGRSFLSGYFAGRDPESLVQEIEVSDRHKSEGELENSPIIHRHEGSLVPL